MEWTGTAGQADPPPSGIEGYTMLDRRRFLGAVAIGAVLRREAAWTAGAAVPDRLSAIDRLNRLGPEGEALARRVGLWDVTETVWASPGAAPVTATGLVAERRMIGSLLQEFIRPPSDTAHAAIKRIDLLSYNRVEGRWDYVSFDTRVPAGLMPAWSAVPGDGTTIELGFAPFAFVGSGKDVTGRLLRMEQVIRYPDPDHDVKDQYFTMADGTATRWLAHRYAYARS